MARDFQRGAAADMMLTTITCPNVSTLLIHNTTPTSFTFKMLARSVTSRTFSNVASRCSVSTLRHASNSSRTVKPAGTLRKAAYMSMLLTLGVGAGAVAQNWSAFKPVDRDSLPFCQEPDAFLDNHKLVKFYRNNPDFIESRYYDRIPKFFLNRMVTRLLFTGPGFLTLEPIVFERNDGKEMVIFFHVGDHLASVTNADVHRGFLTTLMDDGLIRAALSSLPHHYAVTAQLDLEYESHVPANSYLVLKSNLVEVQGRKAWTAGSVDIMKANSTVPAVSGRMLAVEPRYAKYLSWVFDTNQFANKAESV